MRNPNDYPSYLTRHYPLTWDLVIGTILLGGGAGVVLIFLNHAAWPLLADTLKVVGALSVLVAFFFFFLLERWWRKRDWVKEDAEYRKSLEPKQPWQR